MNTLDDELKKIAGEVCRGLWDEDVNFAVFDIDTDPASQNWDYEPMWRGDCYEMPRPCPFATCRWHMASDLKWSGQRMYLNVIKDDIESMSHTCALDIADAGSMSHRDIAELMGVTYQAVQHAEKTALAMLQDRDIMMDDLAGARHQ